MFLLSFLSLPVDENTVKPRAFQRKSKARTWFTAATWARRIPNAPLPPARAPLLCARNQLLAQGRCPTTRDGFPSNFDDLFSEIVELDHWK